MMWCIYDGPYDISYPKRLGWIEAETEPEALQLARYRWPTADIRTSGARPFEHMPIENHMVHWPMWAEKYKNAPGEVGTLARMLQYSLDDKEQMLGRYLKTSSRYTALFFAFIETVDRLPLWARWAVVTPKVSGSASSIGGAFKSIKQINTWRAKNKLNIKDWDDS
jgi:hypothetical protein